MNLVSFLYELFVYVLIVIPKALSLDIYITQVTILMLKEIQLFEIIQFKCLKSE